VNMEWFYEEGGRREGPVSSATLKQLADAGKIRPDTRVWRQGMAQWSEARAIKGLFAASQPAPSSPAPAPTPTPAATPSTPSDPPSPLRSLRGRHPLDFVIDIVRAACPADIAATLSRLAGQAGIQLLYVAAILVTVAGLLISTRTGAFKPFVASIAVSIGLIAIQYVGSRLLGACAAAIQVNKSVLPSLAIPDSAFVLCVVGTVLGAIGLIGLAISEAALNPFFAAIALLVVGGFTALVSIDPAGIKVEVDPQCNAGQEAIGVLTFFVKVLLRCAPIGFAASVAYSLSNLVSLMLTLLQASSQEVAFIAAVRSPLTAAMTFAAAATPVYAYLLLLFYYLTLDVLSAIVSIPRKLDAIADAGNKDNP
jgi:hypothetical protein